MAIAREIRDGQASSTVYLGEPGFLGVHVKTSLDPSGALITGVIGGAAASRAGLVAGDVITGFNGQPVTTTASLSTLVPRYHPGDVVSVSWTATHGSTRTTEITLGNGPYQ
jgi:S1-C subfamily serine protease